MPSLPLERKLPEPYKTTWLQSAAAAAKVCIFVYSTICGLCVRILCVYIFSFSRV